MSIFELSAESMERLKDAIKTYGSGAEKKITNYLHGRGYDVLSASIQNAIPVSDNLKKHGKEQPRSHAKYSKSLTDRDKGKNLAVIIGTVYNRHYLYFPDDGTNTKRHAGNQQFFSTGVAKKEAEVIDELLELLKFEMEE